jgi:hypothetical protein
MKKLIAVALVALFAFGTVNAQTADKKEKSKTEQKVHHKKMHHKKGTKAPKKTEEAKAK